MDRRDFLRLGIAGTVVGACAPTPKDAGTERLPFAWPQSERELFLGRLDSGLLAINDGNPLQGVLERMQLERAIANASPDKVREAETLYRKALRSMLLAGSLRDLPPEARHDAEVAARIQANSDEMDEAIVGMNDYLQGLDPARRAKVQSYLREHPELANGFGEALDLEAANIGISLQRRAHLRSIVAQTSFQLNAQPVATFIDEHSMRVARIAEREYARSVELTKGLDTTKLNGPQKAKKGGTVAGIGGALLGVGALLTAVGIASNSVGGLFVATAGVIMLVGGLVVLIVGLVMLAVE